MHFNLDKRQVKNDVEVKLGEQLIQQVAKSRYLGSIMRQDDKIDWEVNHRIQAGWYKWRKATRVICDRKVPNKVKGKFYRIAIRPAMLYGSECWA